MEARTDVTPSTSGVISYWQLNKTNLGSCLLELYEKKLWTDVKVRCTDQDKDDDDDRIHAHKMILAARSPVFQQMFFGTLRKCEVDTEAEKRTFDLLLRYVFSDELSLCDDTVSDVLRLAHLYQIQTLVKLCADYLEDILTPEHVCDILQLAMIYEITSLKEACLLIIDKNACDVLDSNGFMNLNKDALLMILKGDTFFASGEKIFKHVKQWAKKQLEDGQSEVSEDITLQYFGKSFDELIGKDRFQIKETLECNIAQGDEGNYARHSVKSQFNITVSKDVNMISLTIGDIEPCFQYDHCVSPNSNPDVSTQDYFVSLFASYTDKVIRLAKYRKPHRSNERRIIEYIKKDKIDLHKASYPAIHGTISIPNLNFTQTFQVNPLQTTHEVFLETPMKLKSFLTYAVELRLMFNCCKLNTKCDYYKMGIKLCSSIEETKSAKGHVVVSPGSDRDFQLKRVRFQNFSNRL